MDKCKSELKNALSALSSAARLLEELGEMDEYCPYRHQNEPRLWSLPECVKCSYRRWTLPGLYLPESEWYESEFRAMCWVIYFLWEARQYEKQSSS